jgi:putative IMPACT (imprinted ancient) family translation regulator
MVSRRPDLPCEPPAPRDPNPLPLDPIDAARGRRLSPDPFVTLAGDGEAETRVKGSTFLALAAPAESEEEARARLEPVQKRFFDASHHCSAWRLRGGAWRANDAGEPSGSAGAPILAAIDGAGVTDCVVVVTRWFGGTKLGVGGLVRAYGDAAALALAASPRRVGTPAARLSIEYGYEHTAAVMRALERAGAAQVEHGYAGDGQRGVVAFAVPLAAQAALGDELREATAGAVEPAVAGRAVLYRNETG